VVANTTVTAVLRPETVLTQFVRMRTKDRKITGKMYDDRRVIALL